MGWIFFSFFAGVKGGTCCFPSFFFLTEMAKQVGEFYSVDRPWGLLGLHDVASI